MTTCDDAIKYVCSRVLFSGFARRATLFLSKNLTVKATRRYKCRHDAIRKDMVVTIGRPNYRERQFLKRYKGTFPTGRTEGWPKRRRR